MYIKVFYWLSRVKSVNSSALPEQPPLVENISKYDLTKYIFLEIVKVSNKKISKWAVCQIDRH